MSIRHRHFKKSPKNQRKRGEKLHRQGETGPRSPPLGGLGHEGSANGRAPLKTSQGVSYSNHQARGPPSGPPIRPVLRHYLTFRLVWTVKRPPNPTKQS